MNTNNIKDVTSLIYHNATVEGTLPKKERHIIVDKALRQSNLLKYVNVIGAYRPEIYRVDGIERITLTAPTSIDIKSTVDEHLLQEVGGSDVIEYGLSVQLAELIDTHLISVLAAKATAITVTESSPTFEDKVCAIQAKYGQSLFNIAVGFKDYLHVISTYQDGFPYNVVYSPAITDGKVYGFTTTDTYVNIIAKGIESKKNILTGQYTFKMDLDTLEIGAIKCYKI